MLLATPPTQMEDAAVDQEPDRTTVDARLTAPIPVFYANATRNLGGAFDVRIEFGYQRGDDAPDWVSSVIMSWEHTQALAASLDRMLTDFQEKAGPLPDVIRAGRAVLEDSDD